MHSRLKDASRTAACWHEPDADDTAVDRWIFGAAWAGAVLVMFAVGIGIL